MRRLARSPKRNKRKVVSGSRVTLPENFAYKPELSFKPLARVTLAVGLPYLLVNRALEKVTMQRTQQFLAFVCDRKNPVKCNACAVARKIETDCLSRNVPISNDPVVRILRNLAEK